MISSQARWPLDQSGDQLLITVLLDIENKIIS